MRCSAARDYNQSSTGGRAVAKTKDLGRGGGIAVWVGSIKGEVRGRVGGEEAVRMSVRGRVRGKGGRGSEDVGEGQGEVGGGGG